jgi:dTDP-4-dehydrorhamnose 3,5-epimerase
MKIDSLKNTDVKLIIPTKFGDDRGHFVEVFNSLRLQDVGVLFSPVQENQSLSRTAGTVRGLHFQTPPVPQAKLVRVLTGRIFDVAVDIRRGSPTYGQWVGETLTAAGGEQLLVPVGFAHGFCTLEPDTEVAYLVDGHYSKENDAGILWNDPEIGIDWPEIAGRVLSAKDASAPRLSEIPPPFA